MRKIYLFFIITMLFLNKQANCKQLALKEGVYPDLFLEFQELQCNLYENDEGDYSNLLHWFWDKPAAPVNPFDLDKMQVLEEELKQKIFGQDHAIRAVVNAFERYAIGFHNGKSPIATLLFAGPTGVGKTQLAKEVAASLFGDESKLIKFNMADYNDSTAVWRLIGAPRGILDSELGGDFTSKLKTAFKQNPYAIILLDEIDRASPDVYHLFAQLFEEGLITDSRGTTYDCRRCLFILTTNLGSQKILTSCDLGRTISEIHKEIQPTLTQALSPEFYNRLETIIFKGLKGEVINEVIAGLLDKNLSELDKNLGIHLNFDASVVEFIRENAANYALGARPLKEKINRTVGTAIGEAIKNRYLKRGDQAFIFYIEGVIYIQVENKNAFRWDCPVEEGKLSPPFNFEDILNLESNLQKQVVGQPYAINMVVSALKRYAVGLANPNAPIGSFLFVGPTGVGKTELAKELSRQLLGSESHLIRLDMSEYSESHSVSKLIGSPPGYVGHDDGGQLTETLKQHPYAIVLLDEIEKAHPIVVKTFLQVFDEGRLTDAKGSLIDCRNVIFIATTNLASQSLLILDQEGYTEKEIIETIRPEVIQYLSPELYNRLEIALFKGLSIELIDQLIDKMLEELQANLLRIKNMDAHFDVSIRDYLRENGFDFELGARPLKRLVQQALVTSIATAIIAGEIDEGDHISVSYDGEQIIVRKIN